MIVRIQDVEISPWKEVNGKVVLFYPVHMKIAAGASFPEIRLDGYVALESAAAVEPATFTRESPAPNWNINYLRWHRYLAVAPPAPPGPPGKPASSVPSTGSRTLHFQPRGFLGGQGRRQGTGIVDAAMVTCSCIDAVDQRLQIQLGVRIRFMEGNGNDGEWPSELACATPCNRARRSCVLLAEDRENPETDRSSAYAGRRAADRSPPDWPIVPSTGLVACAGTDPNPGSSLSCWSATAPRVQVTRRPSPSASRISMKASRNSSSTKARNANGVDSSSASGSTTAAASWPAEVAGLLMTVTSALKGLAFSPSASTNTT